MILRVILTHLHPSKPARSFILAMAKANSPETAPPVAAELYSNAIRLCVSFGRYHCEIIRMAPGKNPALES